MKDLQKAVHDIMTSTTDQGKHTALKKAFEVFSSDTQRLERAYDSLSEQFQSLNLALQDTNHKLQYKIAELDLVTHYLKNILDNIIQGILVIDLNGTITTCNRAAEEILGIDRQDILSKRFWDIFPNELFGFPMQTALQSKPKVGSYTVSYTSPAHHSSELEIVTTFAFKQTKEVNSESQGMIVMLKDVTEMKQLQIMASRADRMKLLGEMASHVAHEIRNPLGGIKGFASLLKKDLVERPDLQKMATSIVEGTDTLNHLVTQILQYTRPIQLHLENVDVSNLLKETREHILADTNIYRSNIDFIIDAPTEPLIIPLDAGYFKSAILNLLVNAFQAMPEGGTVTCCLRATHRYMILSISDTGLGISEENLAKLYSPFFTTKPEGNGLGLVEVQKVIQAHGGTIDVSSILNQSLVENHGTVFTIKLPLHRTNK